MSQDIREIRVFQVFEDEDVPAGTTVRADPIDLVVATPGGMFSLQWDVSGASATSFQHFYEGSNNGTDFVAPSGRDTIHNAVTTTSGVADQDLAGFQPELMKFLKIGFENQGSASCVVSSWLAMQ